MTRFFRNDYEKYYDLFFPITESLSYSFQRLGVGNNQIVERIENRSVKHGLVN